MRPCREPAEASEGGGGEQPSSLHSPVLLLLLGPRCLDSPKPDWPVLTLSQAFCFPPTVTEVFKGTRPRPSECDIVETERAFLQVI